MEPKTRPQPFDVERLVQIAGGGTVDGAERQPRQVRQPGIVDPRARA